MHRSALDWHWLASVHLKVGQIGVQPDFKEFMKLLSHHVCSVCSSTRNTKHGIRDACSTADCCPLLSILSVSYLIWGCSHITSAKIGCGANKQKEGEGDFKLPTPPVIYEMPSRPSRPPLSPSHHSNSPSLSLLDVCNALHSSFGTYRAQILFHTKTSLLVSP